MPQIIPIKDLKNTSEISQKCHETDEPIFITKNGYGDMVIMSIDVYEKLQIKLDVYNKLAEAEEDVKQGRTQDAFEFLKELRAECEKR